MLKSENIFLGLLALVCAAMLYREFRRMGGTLPASDATVVADGMATMITDPVIIGRGRFMPPTTMFAKPVANANAAVEFQDSLSGRNCGGC